MSFCLGGWQETKDLAAPLLLWLNSRRLSYMRLFTVIFGESAVIPGITTPQSGAIAEDAKATVAYTLRDREGGVHTRLDSDSDSFRKYTGMSELPNTY